MLQVGSLPCTWPAYAQSSASHVPHVTKRTQLRGSLYALASLRYSSYEREIVNFQRTNSLLTKMLPPLAVWFWQFLTQSFQEMSYDAQNAPCLFCPIWQPGEDRGSLTKNLNFSPNFTQIQMNGNSWLMVTTGKCCFWERRARPETPKLIWPTMPFKNKKISQQPHWKSTYAKWTNKVFQHPPISPKDTTLSWVTAVLPRGWLSPILGNTSLEPNIFRW